ncbi:hypothetical protein K505DRAFT_419134, partial [Melanomma pulvis-pyrius CBS 109.77]
MPRRAWCWHGSVRGTARSAPVQRAAVRMLDGLSTTAAAGTLGGGREEEQKGTRPPESAPASPRSTNGHFTRRAALVYATCIVLARGIAGP